MVGCGKMGGALLGQWLADGTSITVVDPMVEAVPEGVRLVRGIADLGDSRFDVIVVAIKPQVIDEVLPPYAGHIAPGGYVLSVAAGCSIERLTRVLGGAPVVRVMPNLPAALGKGVSGLCAGPGAEGAPLTHATALVRRTGTAVVVDSEEMIDRVTAVSGSGPGYVFELARAYVEAAVELGFSPQDARAMVLGTIDGAVAMALADPGAELADLRNSVTSKGGTTAAGLAALNGDGEMSIRLRDTLEAAYNRAVELR